MFIFCSSLHRDHDGANFLTSDVRPCANGLGHGEGADVHDGKSMDFDGEHFCGICLSDGEIYCAYTYIHAHDKNGDILSRDNSIRDSRNKLLNMNSINHQSLHTHRDRVRSTKSLQMKPM